MADYDIGIYEFTAETLGGFPEGMQGGSTGTLLRWTTGLAYSGSTGRCKVTIQYSDNEIPPLVPNTPPYVVRDLVMEQETSHALWHPNVDVTKRHYYIAWIYYEDTDQWHGPYYATADLTELSIPEGGQGGDWESGSYEPAPYPVYAAGYCTYGDKIYVIGGVTEDRTPYLDKIISYTPEGDKYNVNLRPMPSGARDAMAVDVSEDGNIYVAGGYRYGSGNSTLSHLEKYDIDEDTWTILKPMPEANFYASGVIYGNYFYVFGGSTDKIYKYSIENNTWETLTPDENMAGIGKHPVTAVIGDFIWVIGGSKHRRHVDKWDPSTNNWVQNELYTSAPLDVYRAASAVRGDKIYMASGEISTSETTGVAVKDFKSYDVARDKWDTSINDMPTARLLLAGGIIGDKFYVIGGKLEGEPGEITNITEACKLAAFLPPPSSMGKFTFKDKVISTPIPRAVFGSVEPFTEGNLSFSKLNTNTKLDSSQDIVVDIVVWLPEGQDERKSAIKAALRAIAPAHVKLNVLYERYYIAQTTTEQFNTAKLDDDVYKIENGVISNKVPTIDSSYSGTTGFSGSDGRSGLIASGSFGPVPIFLGMVNEQGSLYPENGPLDYAKGLSNRDYVEPGAEFPLTSYISVGADLGHAQFVNKIVLWDNLSDDGIYGSMYDAIQVWFSMDNATYYFMEEFAPCTRTHISGSMWRGQSGSFHSITLEFPAIAARYFRGYMVNGSLKSADGNKIKHTEIETFYDRDGFLAVYADMGVPIFKGMSLVHDSSPTNSVLEINNDLIDGDLDTVAVSEEWGKSYTYKGSIGLDLGPQQDPEVPRPLINSIVLYDVHIGEGIRAHDVGNTVEVYSSDDNANWTLVKTYTPDDTALVRVTTEYSSVYEMAMNFSADDARYWKVYASNENLQDESGTIIGEYTEIRAFYV